MKKRLLMIRETGIIMSGDHPKLILDGRKTQTRRVIKPQPHTFIDRWVWAFKKGKLATQGYWLDHCPYGQVGDRLWVRETFCDGCYQRDKVEDVCYKEDLIREGQLCHLTQCKWKLSIHMFKWMARIWLEITEVRVERLAEILWTDIIHEGLNPQGKSPNELKHEFITLWDSLNAKRGYGWEVNPWVWVIGFKVVK